MLDITVDTNVVVSSTLWAAVRRLRSTLLCGRGAGGGRWYVVANYYGRSRAYVAFQVRLTPELKDQLIRRSFETGQSQMAIVNKALEAYFANVASESSDSPSTSSTGTANNEKPLNRDSEN